MNILTTVLQTKCANPVSKTDLPPVLHDQMETLRWAERHAAATLQRWAKEPPVTQHCFNGQITLMTDTMQCTIYNDETS
jgi:Tat protein secretion system quality control protein TatD with DNase activity